MKVMLHKMYHSLFNLYNFVFNSCEIDQLYCGMERVFFYSFITLLEHVKVNIEHIIKTKINHFFLLEVHINYRARLLSTQTQINLDLNAQK